MVEFQVLQCSECQTFQVLQVTKSLKWKCKLCGSKQSLIKVYGRGTGADCRRHVQKLNTLRGELDQIKEDASFQKPVSLPSCTITDNNRFNPQRESSSHWTRYLDSPSDYTCHEEESQPDVLDGVLVTTDRSLYVAEQKESRRNKRKITSKEHHDPQDPSYIKRYKDLREQCSSDFTPRKSPTHPSSVGSLHFRKESYQSSPLHFQDRQANKGLFEPGISTERMRITSSLEINSDQVKIPLSEEKMNHHIKPEVHSKPMSLLNPDERSVTRNATDVSKCSVVNKSKANGFSSKSTKASKWDNFLEDDQCESSESDNDTEFAPNDYGQLTVLLPSNDSSDCFFNL